VVFLLDGDRQRVYSPNIATPTNSFAHLMFSHFLKACDAASNHCIDMTPVFSQHCADNGERFEFANDWHWNSLGHAVAAREVAKRMVEIGFGDLNH